MSAGSTAGPSCPPAVEMDATLSAAVIPLADTNQLTFPRLQGASGHTSDLCDVR